MRVDPTGMEDHDYKVSKDGKISEKPIRETKDNFDRLILFDQNDQETENSIEVDKNILDNVKRNQMSETKVNYSYFRVNNNEKAKSIFEFLSDNTNVEWGHVSFGSKSNYISTNNNEISESGGAHLISKLMKEKFTVNFYNHSHPNDGKEYNYYGPSGGYSSFDKLGKGQGDNALAKYIDSMNKYYKQNMKLGVYESTIKKYFQFNKDKILK